MILEFGFPGLGAASMAGSYRKGRSGRRRSGGRGGSACFGGEVALPHRRPGGARPPLGGGWADGGVVAAAGRGYGRGGGGDGRKNMRQGGPRTAHDPHTQRHTPQKKWRDSFVRDSRAPSPTLLASS